MIKDLPGLVAHLKSEILARTDYAVVGLSGGIDSTVVATLCTQALGTENVMGLHMPYGQTDYAKFNARSVRLAKHLRIEDVIIPVDKIASYIAVAVQSAGFYMNDVNLGNARSRARMSVLYAVAHSLGASSLTRVRVIGTGNLSEDYIGYDTKGGDALCDFFPIGELFKSEVYQLAEYLGLPEDLIDRVPSAGLWEGQTDEDELGFTYNQMEPIIKEELAVDTHSIYDKEKERIRDFVQTRHAANKHKHEAPPVIPIRNLGFTD